MRTVAEIGKYQVTPEGTAAYPYPSAAVGRYVMQERDQEGGDPF